MAKRLQELRREAGFSTAKEFAESMGIPPTTYTRYESQPGKIPLRTAWSLADHFGVSIDEVVGRASPRRENVRGEEQRAFDELLPRSQEEVRDFMGFLAERDAREEGRSRRLEMRRWDAIASRIERAFLAGIAESDSTDGVSLLLATTDGELRDAYEEFARGWVVGAERPLNPLAPEKRDEEAMGEVMAAYDRAHETSEPDDMGVEWSGAWTAGEDGGGAVR